jgi:hypothetical protein
VNISVWKFCWPGEVDEDAYEGFGKALANESCIIRSGIKCVVGKYETSLSEMEYEGDDVTFGDCYLVPYAVNSACYQYFDDDTSSEANCECVINNNYEGFMSYTACVQLARLAGNDAYPYCQKQQVTHTTNEGGFSGTGGISNGAGI